MKMLGKRKEYKEIKKKKTDVEEKTKR